MLVANLFTIFAAASSATAAIVPRDAATIKKDITAIATALTTLNNTLNTFNGGLAGTGTALVIQGQATDLQKKVDQATTDTKASAALSDSDSSSVTYAVVSLTPKIYSVLSNIVAKKPAFDTAVLGIGSASLLVKGDLIGLKNSTDYFGGNLTTKLVPSLANVAPLLIGAIDYHFDQALKVYA